ncbi:hypothetical protein OXX80_009678 [Metschnikowia pulcherrima]|uniref:Uncharacterized protein n=1 Tax=Metschnikowia pulcherrima TaxID=27326 RepID=A0A8H7GX99_9ASCO|nr:hypothetical protein HF325_000079 [Metschnikowia pulcherrima]
MDFNSLMSKGKETLGGKDGKGQADLQKGAEEAYKTFNATEGTYQEKATAAFSEYQKNQAATEPDEKKDETADEKKD